jgi:hypothetical protein
MYNSRTLSLAFLAVLTVAEILCYSDSDVRIGVRVANAKEFYTRKRVNGHWITGRFSKRERTRARQSKPGVPKEAQATPVRPPIAEQPPSLPAIQPIIGEAPLRPEPPGAPATVVSAPPLSAEPPLTTDHRLLKLQEALLARAAGLTRPPSEEQSPGVQTTGSLAVRSGLRSVHFDFDSGIRTTTLCDGRTMAEPFDTAVEQRIGPAARP